MMIGERTGDPVDDGGTSSVKLDLSAPNPTIQFGKADLIGLITGELERQTPDIEVITLAYDELVRRGKPGKASSILKTADIVPIPWLSDARKSLEVLVPPGTGKQNQVHLYTILIEGYSIQNGTCGVYVGSSIYPAEIRFQQHKDGIKASPKVKNRGIQVLHSLCWPWRKVPGGKERLAWETALHQCLELVVPKVSGDVIGSDELPKGFQRGLYEK